MSAVSWILLAAACSRPSAEEALRRSMAELREAVVAGDAAAVAGHLSVDFIGPGGLDRDAARRMAALHFLRDARVDALPGPLDVELHDGVAARVRFTVALAGGDGG